MYLDQYLCTENVSCALHIWATVSKGSNPFVVIRGGLTKLFVLIFILSHHSIGSCLKNTLYVNFSWFFKNFKICRHFVQPFVLVPSRFVRSYDVGFRIALISLTYIHTYIHICMHAYIHTCIHACMYAYIHACIHTYPLFKHDRA